MQNILIIGVEICICDTPYDYEASQYCVRILGIVDVDVAAN